MNVKFLGNTKFRYTLLLVLVFCFFCILALIMGRQFIAKQLVQQKTQITAVLEKELGSPVSFDNLEMHGFGLAVSMRQVLLLEPKTSVPLISADTITITPNWTALILSQQYKIKKIIIKGLKLRVEWDEKNAFSIPGFKKLSTGSIGLKSLDSLNEIETLAMLESVQIKEAEIHWQGPDIEFKQFGSAEFKWKPGELSHGFTATGNQQLQIRQGLPFPELDFQAEVGSQFKSATIDVIGKKWMGSCQLASEEAQWQTDCKVDFNALDLTKLHMQYSPAEQDLKLIQWLANALKTGHATHGTVQIKGPLNALQWQGEIHYRDVDFQFSPDWPDIKKAKGFVKIEPEKVFVQLVQGEMKEIPLEPTSAIIEPVGSGKNPTVSVTGSLSSSLEFALIYLKDSPLKDSIAKRLEMLDPTGPMHLKLKLDIPLAETEKISVDGLLSVQYVQLKLPGWESGLDDLNGDFHFTEQSIDAPDVSAYWMQHPLQLTIETVTDQKQRRMTVTGKTVFSSEFLQQHIQSPLLDKFVGKSLWTVLLDVPLHNAGSNHPIEWILSSDLEGSAIQLPSPLAKPADEKKMLTVTVGSTEKNERKIAIQLEKTLDAKIVTSGEGAALKFLRGDLVLGGDKANWISANVFKIGGKIEDFNAKEWLDYIGTEKEKNEFPPIELRLLVEKLSLYGLNFNHSWVSTRFTKTPLEWGIEGDSIKGIVSLPTDGKKSFTIDLDYLKIAKTEETSEESPEFLKEQGESSIFFRCKDLNYNQSYFGTVSFSLIPKSHGYDINRLIISTRISELSGEGEWHLEDDKSYTFLQGKVVSSDMGKLFSEWGYPSPIRESGGYINFNFRWSKNPFQFSIANLNGSAQLKLKKGRILGVNPGLGRILGLLNVESIQRRLRLDFSDIFKKGFVFDQIKGNFSFEKGMATTDMLLIDGPSAKIELKGTANLKNKSIDLKMGVVPQIGIGLPIAAAAALAGPVGALGGAGVWLLNKLTGSKIIQNYYHVTGTWEEPKLQDLGEARRQGATN